MAFIDNIVRPVGSKAKFDTARHSLGILRPVIVTCRYQVPAALLRRLSLSLHDTIENAVAAVVLGQPMLCVGIAGEDTKEPAFVQLGTIDMRRMIEWREIITSTASSLQDRQPGAGDEEGSGGGGGGEQGGERARSYEDGLLRSIERHHEALWEDLPNKPGWKIVVHHDPSQLGVLRLGGEEEEKLTTTISLDISFCFHHAYADGKSGYLFHGDLQRALNGDNDDAARPPEQLRDHILHLPIKMPPFPPAMDVLITFNLSWTFILRTIWDFMLYPLLVPRALRRLLRLEPTDAEAERNRPWTGQPVDESNPRVHVRSLLEIDDDAQLRKILALCRRHGASLTGLLHALIARSLARRISSLSSRGEGEVPSFCSNTPVALEAHANPDPAFTPGKTIHCLITGHICDHPADAVRTLLRSDDDDALWEFARDMTTRIRAKAASPLRDDLIALSNLIDDWHGHFRAKFGKPREDSWEVSNLGSLDAVAAGGDREDWWRINRAIFTQGNALGAALSINVAGVAAHGIYVTVTWQDGIVDVALVEAFVDDVRASVKTLEASS